MTDIEPQIQTSEVPQGVKKSALKFSAGTILSRITGFLREVAMSAWLGASPALAAFLIAYRASQLLRRLFGESSLSSGFIPHFEELKLENQARALSFFRDLLSSMIVILGGVLAVLELVFLGYLHWADPSTHTKEILILTMIMLPGVFFICLYALFSAVLQSDKKYFIVGVAPVFFNLVYLAVLWCVKDIALERGILILAFGVTVAFFIQAVALALSARPLLQSIEWKRVQICSPELKKILSAVALTIVGVGASQLNGFIDTLFARAAHLSGPAYLYYAMRLYQLPLAVFGIALSSALLPPLCRACQKGEKIAFINLMQFALRKSFSLMIPLSISLIALGHPLIHFVYLRGAFDIQAAMHTTECLIGYAIGLCFSVMVLILAPAFYAKKDFRTPLKGSLISIGLNIILNGLFIYVFRWRISTVAFSTSFVTFFNAFYLYQALKRQEREKLIDRKTWVASFKVTAASVAAAVSAWGCMHFFVPSPDTFLGRSIELIQQGSIFSLTFLVLAWILKIDEFFESTGLSFLVRQKESIKKL